MKRTKGSQKGPLAMSQGAKGESQEELGGTKNSQEEPGCARRNQEELLQTPPRSS